MGVDSLALGAGGGIARHAIPMLADARTHSRADVGIDRPGTDGEKSPSY